MCGNNKGKNNQSNQNKNKQDHGSNCSKNQ
jgi:hypothetical protein